MEEDIICRTPNACFTHTHMRMRVVALILQINVREFGSFRIWVKLDEILEC
jgi:hypothetical protein